MICLKVMNICLQFLIPSHQRQLLLISHDSHHLAE
jgi:hypothetical protein